MRTITCFRITLQFDTPNHVAAPRVIVESVLDDLNQLARKIPGEPQLRIDSEATDDDFGDSDQE